MQIVGPKRNDNKPIVSIVPYSSHSKCHTQFPADVVVISYRRPLLFSLNFFILFYRYVIIDAIITSVLFFQKHGDCEPAALI